MAKKKKITTPEAAQQQYADFQQIGEGSGIFKQMFKYSVIPIIIHDMEMNIINANDAAVEQFGYSRDELLDISIFDLHPKEELEHSNQVLNEMQQKNKLSVETSFVRKDGSVFFAEATPCKYLLGDKPIIHVFIQDITERKLREKELRDFNRQLQIKNSELEQFAYVASHDLQEPLRTINLVVELLVEKYHGKFDEDANQSLEFLADASSHMRNLVRGLLEYSRIGRNEEFSDVDCNKLVDVVQKDLSLFIQESNATFEIGELPHIKGSETDLRMLFQNLISNAIKYRKADTAPHIIIKAVKDNDNWLFSVQDNGIGFEEKYYEKIFVIFQRLHSRDDYEGTGIGLAHCKKIVDLHGGNIWVKSKPGVGSTFYFTIPAV